MNDHYWVFFSSSQGWAIKVWKSGSRSSLAAFGNIPQSLNLLQIEEGRQVVAVSCFTIEAKTDAAIVATWSLRTSWLRAFWRLPLALWRRL